MDSEKIYTVETSHGSFKVKGDTLSSNGTNWFVYDKEQMVVAIFNCNVLKYAIAESAKVTET